MVRKSKSVTTKLSSDKSILFPLSKRARNYFLIGSPLFTVTRLELLLLVALIVSGAIYLWNPMRWSSAYIGSTQYGDAEFWWNGAIHFSKGIIGDSPGKGFRPGYFILTGQALAALGNSFSLFHKYLLAVFFWVVAFLYFALREWLGRFAAGVGIALIVLNPFTAEWLSTATTDATGFLLNALALACLIFGIQKQPLRLRWFIAFGFLFSLGTLTRPLVTPFIGVVLIYVSFFLVRPLRIRVQVLSTLVLAFLLPALLWMCVQKITINEWSISTNDASAFYGASDPSIQVWNGDMYTKIQQLAGARHGVQFPTVPQINQEFWLQTLANYKQYWRYHLHRMIPHLKVIAKFGPELTNHPHPNLRRALFLLFCGVFFLSAIWNRNFKGAASALFAGVCIRWLNSIPLFLFFGLILALKTMLGKKSNRDDRAILLASYWITGSFALALVGGTWGDPFGPASVSLNALGYRLGMQVFFISDLCILFFLQRLFKMSDGGVALLPTSKWTTPDKLSSSIVSSVLGILLIASIAVQLGGSIIVAKRSYDRSVAIHVPYPALVGLKEALTAQGLLTASDQLETGTTSDFLWTLGGQDRSQILFYTEKDIFPFEMHPNRKIIEISRGSLGDIWKYRQGAYIFKDFKDLASNNNQPYYLSAPTLRAFIPVSTAQDGFRIEKAEWYPVAKYASRLVAAGEMSSDSSLLTWDSGSGPAPYKRRFSLMPLPGSHEGHLLLDLKNARGKRHLTFEWAPEYGDSVARKALSERPVVKVLMKFSRGKEIRYFQSLDRGLKQVKLLLDDSRLTKVDLSFLNLPKEGVKIYEFNLVADDFLIN